MPVVDGHYTLLGAKAEKLLKTQLEALWASKDPRYTANDIVKILKFGVQGTIYEGLKPDKFWHYKERWGLPNRQCRLSPETEEKLRHQLTKLWNCRNPAYSCKDIAAKLQFGVPGTPYENLNPSHAPQYYREKFKLPPRPHELFFKSYCIVPPEVKKQLKQELEPLWKKRLAGLIETREIIEKLQLGVVGTTYEKTNRDSIHHYAEQFGFPSLGMTTPKLLPVEQEQQLRSKLTVLRDHSNPKYTHKEMVDLLKFGVAGTPYENLNPNHLSYYRYKFGLPLRARVSSNFMERIIKKLGKLKVDREWSKFNGDWGAFKRYLAEICYNQFYSHEPFVVYKETDSDQSFIAYKKTDSRQLAEEWIRFGGSWAEFKRYLAENFLMCDLSAKTEKN